LGEFRAARRIDGARLHHGLARPELREDALEHALHGGRVGHDDLHDVGRGGDRFGRVFPRGRRGLRRAVPAAGEHAGRRVTLRPGAANDAKSENADGFHK
jgi:hypothetical protein